MKRTKITFKLLTIILILISIITFTGCNNKYKPKVFNHTYSSYFNTVSSIKILYDKVSDFEDFEAIVNETDGLLSKLDKIFNRYDQDSEVYKVNKSSGKEKVKVSSEFIELLNLIISECEKLESYSGSKVIDPTVGPLTTLWNFNSYNYLNCYEIHNAPSKENIDLALAKVNYKDIIIEDDTVFLKNEGQELDLGAFVKGYATNKMRDLLIELGVDRAVIDLGGNLGLIGQISEDELYNCGIVNPEYLSHLSKDGYRTIGNVYLKDTSIVTSGSYERYIKTEDDIKYHHILSLIDGYSANNGIVSVSVISSDSFICDAYSTSLFILGLDKAMNLVNQTENLECVIVVEALDGYEIYVSNGLEDNFIYNEKLNDIKFEYRGVYENITN